MESLDGGSFNRFGYVSQSPYNYIDPDGRNEEDPPMQQVEVKGKKEPKPPPPPAPRPAEETPISVRITAIAAQMPTFPQAFVDCVDAGKWDWGNLGTAGNGGGTAASEAMTAANLANSAANMAAGPTGAGIGTASHATSWQHRLASNYGQAQQIAATGKRTGAIQAKYSAIGKAAGRIAIIPTIWEGYWNIGTIARCGSQ